MFFNFALNLHFERRRIGRVLDLRLDTRRVNLVRRVFDLVLCFTEQEVSSAAKLLLNTLEILLEILPKFLEIYRMAKAGMPYTSRQHYDLLRMRE